MLGNSFWWRFLATRGVAILASGDDCQACVDFEGATRSQHFIGDQVAITNRRRQLLTSRQGRSDAEDREASIMSRKA